VKRSVSNETSFVFYDAGTVVVGSAKSVRSSVDVKTGETQSVAQNSKFAEALLQNPAAAVRFRFGTDATDDRRIANKRFAAAGVLINLAGVWHYRLSQLESISMPHYESDKCGTRKGDLR
jgi:RecB family exonuclease